MMLFLKLNGYELTAPKEERVIKFIQLASSSITANDFANWLKSNTKHNEILKKVSLFFGNALIHSVSQIKSVFRDFKLYG